MPESIDQYIRDLQIKKNKIYNPKTLKKQLNHHDFEDPMRKLTKTKLMKFIIVELERFHPYLLVEFYKKAVIAANGKSFETKVYNTKLTVSTQFLAEEFGLCKTGASIFTYLNGNANIEKIH